MFEHRPKPLRIFRRTRRRGRVLAVRPGLNPNSSSLGVDVTFLLFGAGALALLTPIVAAIVRIARPEPEPGKASDSESDAKSGGATD